MEPDASTDPNRGCEATPARIGAFLAGTLDTADAAAFRRHREGCEACEEEWRTAVRTTARMHHRERIETEGETKRERREHHRRLALEGAFAAPTRPGKKVRRARMRLLLLPALAIVLMAVVFPSSRRAETKLEALEGSVELAWRSLVPEDGPFTVRRADWFTTGPDTRARLTLGPAAITVEPATRVVIEDAEAGRVRLVSGTLALSGDGVVTSIAGVVEVEAGEARVTLGRHGLAVSAEGGRVVAADSAGERVVSAGEETHLGVR